MLALAILSAIITFLFVSPLEHDGMEREDEGFRAYLEEHGYDTSQMGLTAEERAGEVLSATSFQTDEKHEMKMESA